MYRDLRHYIDELDHRRLLHIIDEPVCKDTELMPLVRLQFRGAAEESRKAFWFRQVTDARRRRFNASVLVGALGSSRWIYAAALGVTEDAIASAWAQAQGRHVAPRTVATNEAPVKYHIRRAPRLDDGIDSFPHVISTPGFDPAPFITAGVWVTRDPETGVYNLGIYRGMIKAPDRIGCATDVPTQHLAIHWEKARRMGRPLEAALFIGGPPALLLAAASKVPYGVDEYGLAGALNGAPIDVTRADTSKAKSARMFWNPKRLLARRAATSARARWRNCSRSRPSVPGKIQFARRSSANFHRAKAR